MARPPKYKPEFAKQAAVACKLGARDLDLAEMFGVTLRCVQMWRVNHPEFKEATDLPKKLADSQVERSLYERACGYQTTETELKVVNGEVIPVDVIKHYPPDPTSMIFWLKNRKPKEWRDRVESETPKDDRNITINIVDAKKPDAN